MQELCRRNRLYRVVFLAPTTFFCVGGGPPGRMIVEVLIPDCLPTVCWLLRVGDEHERVSKEFVPDCVSFTSMILRHGQASNE